MSVIKYQFRDVEKIKTSIWQDARKGSIHIAQVIAQAIKEKAAKGENILLGLSTGNSPVQVYKELVRMHKEEGLSFKNVISFNLDEYYPMQPDASQSYVAFMKFHLFDHNVKSQKDQNVESIFRTSKITSSKRTSKVSKC